VAEKALTRGEIAALAGVDRETVNARIGDLAVSLGARGIRLIESGERVELATAPEAGRLIARYVGADAPRLSNPSLETLAIVAYRQPCTRATIERIRGVDTDYTLRTLLHRRLIVELGRSQAPGRPILYGTGFDFLERFGMTSLEDLPPWRPRSRRGSSRPTPMASPLARRAEVTRERLQKVIASAGIASRRAGDDLIRAGR